MTTEKIKIKKKVIKIGGKCLGVTFPKFLWETYNLKEGDLIDIVLLIKKEDKERGDIQ